jgi:NDP-sugar pyrophosphorylase family protein
MKGVILAAGKGTRMREVSFDLPKILLPFGDRTIGDNIAQGLRDAGAVEILLVVGHMEEEVREHFGDGSAQGVRFHYVRQNKQLGTGHAASLSRDFIGNDPFVLCYGDIATPRENLVGLVGDFRRESPEISMSIFRVQDPSAGAAVYVEDGYMKRLIEKPPLGSSTTAFDNAGIYIFTPAVFEVLDRVGLSPRNEYELTDVLTMVAGAGRRVRAYEMSGFWSNVSSPEELLSINNLVIDGLKEQGFPDASASGGQSISSLAIVHPQSVLGRCTVGDYTIVMRGARVGDGAQVSRAILCRDVVIGQGAALDYVLVRPAATVAPNVRCSGTRKRVLILPDEMPEKG